MAKQKTLTKEKMNGEIYTPNYIVKNILDLCNYKGNVILHKHIIDNSCGDGAFLVEIVHRYCEVAENIKMSNEQLSSELSKFIHGIEIDIDECKKCICNLNAITKKLGIDVDWDIKAENALDIKRYNNKMDYVVGNPPYVRVHNLLDNYNSVKEYSFSQNGMTDLFIVFYEIGLNMLNENGVLGYISPSSIFNSLAGSTMREHLVYNHNIKSVTDLKHFQPFEATTYTTIMILTKEYQKSVIYYEYDKVKLKPFIISELKYEDFYINKSFIFNKKIILDKLKNILSYNNEYSVCEVKNGFATLFDDFFIGDFDFEDYTIPIVKASTGKKSKCLFPYDNNSKIIPFESLAINPAIRKYYEINETKLKSRSLDMYSTWYGFGRSQGIKDINKKKYAINVLIRDINDIKLSVCNAGTGVYSGLYILSDIDIEELKSILFTDEFVAYIKMLGKYKSGGYYTYSSKDLQRFINYKFYERKEHKYEQLTIS